MIKNEPLDMQQYGMILGTHRRPAPQYDRLLHTDDAKHVIIMSNNNVRYIQHVYIICNIFYILTLVSSFLFS